MLRRVFAGVSQAGAIGHRGPDCSVACVRIRTDVSAFAHALISPLLVCKERSISSLKSEQNRAVLKQDVRRALDYWCRSQGVCKVLRVLMLQDVNKVKYQARAARWQGVLQVQTGATSLPCNR